MPAPVAGTGSASAGKMTAYLRIDAAELKAKDSYWTAREIAGQPALWRATGRAVAAGRGALDDWLRPLLTRADLRIVLTGAGSSAFIGETLAPWLRGRLRRRVEAIGSTELVAAPAQYLAEDLPTLLISFARSGDSPESLAAIELADQMLGKCQHLLLTCNPDGGLAGAAQGRADRFCLLLPDGAHDQSFAMTGSFSSMLAACASIFTPDADQLEQAARLAETLIAEQAAAVRELAQADFTRLVTLGAGSLLGAAREIALKCLELSAGRVVALADSPLGFRHGPKSVVDQATLIVQLRSADPRAAAYDRDLYHELIRDDRAFAVVALTAGRLGARIAPDDIWLALPCLVYGQMLAFYKALALGVAADNPCPGGQVNRVVQGVKIYPYRPDVSDPAPAA